MDIFGAARGWYNQILTEAAFDMNKCVQSQNSEDALKTMVNAIRRYGEASECLQLLDQLEQTYKVRDPIPAPQPEPQDEN